jgi:hypothetical protein
MGNPWPLAEVRPPSLAVPGNPLNGFSFSSLLYLVTHGSSGDTEAGKDGNLDQVHDYAERERSANLRVSRS